VLQDADQPGALARLPFELPSGLKCGEERLLDQVLRLCCIADVQQRISVQSVTVPVDPGERIGRWTGWRRSGGSSLGGFRGVPPFCINGDGIVAATGATYTLVVRRARS
jgi:hypothetical protein